MRPHYVKPWLSVDPGAYLINTEAKKGSTSFVNWGCYLKGVSLGEGVIIAPNVTMVSSHHPTYIGIPIKDQKTINKPITVGDGAYIGAGATILAGCKVGNGAVIGAGAVLTEDTEVKDNEIWAGNPAKYLRMRKEKV